MGDPLVDSEANALAILHECDRLVDGGRHLEAVALMRAAVTRFPDDPEVCLRAALVVLETDPESSRLWARTAAENVPGDPGMQFRAATALFNAGDLHEAWAAATKAARVGGEDFPLLPELLHLMGRITADGNGDPAYAETAMREAFEAAPEVLDHGAYLAAFLAERGRVRSATEVVRTALVHHPENSYLHELQAFLCRQLDQNRASGGSSVSGRARRPHR